MGAGGVILHFLTFAIRILQLLDSAVILGIYSYFLASLSQNNRPIARWMKATEGLAGAAVLYALIASLLTCCLGGIPFFSVIAIILDVCFVGAMIAIAIMTRDGTQSCGGYVSTPVGSGPGYSDSTLTGVNLGLACRMEKAVFAVAILGIFFFLFSILFEFFLARHEKREKRFGPSPANGYTSGSRRRPFWWSKGRPASAAVGEDSLPTHPTPQDVEYGTRHNNRTFANGTNGVGAGAAAPMNEKSRFYKSGFLGGRKKANTAAAKNGVDGAGAYGRY